MIFNIIKHHFWDTIFILHQFKNLQKNSNNVLKLLNKIGRNHCDVYKGNLTTKEILEEYQNKKNYLLMFYEKQNFKMFLCKDNSLWIIKDIYKNSKQYKHIHPARNTIIKNYSSTYEINPKLHIRIDANKYKIILLCYWLYLSEIKENHMNFLHFLYNVDLIDLINTTRKKLNLSEISNLHFNKELYLNLFLQFFEK